MPRELKLLRSTVRTTSVCHHLVFENAGWALFTINDETGEFSIQSAWGNYGFRWSTTSLGKQPDGTLTKLSEFLPDCEPDYIVAKLAMDREREFREVFDLDATAVGLKRRILEYRRDGGRRDIARSLWETLLDFLGELAHEPPETQMRLLVEGPWPKAHADNCIYDDIWDFFVHRPSPRYTFLVEQLIPFFQRYLRGAPAEPPSSIPPWRVALWDGINAFADARGATKQGGARAQKAVVSVESAIDEAREDARRHARAKLCSHLADTLLAARDEIVGDDPRKRARRMGLEMAVRLTRQAEGTR